MALALRAWLAIRASCSCMAARNSLPTESPDAKLSKEAVLFRTCQWAAIKERRHGYWRRRRLLRQTRTHTLLHAAACRGEGAGQKRGLCAVALDDDPAACRPRVAVEEHVPVVPVAVKDDPASPRLLGDLAPSKCAWTYPLKDEEWRCFAGYLEGAFDKDRADKFFNIIRDGTKWHQPTGRWGPLPLKTAWMAQAPCSCRYRYGGAEVPPEPFPEWLEDVLGACMPLCGLPQKEAWPNSCNLNLYEDGQHSVGWHADNESLFQGKVREIRIISLSFGQTRKFELKYGKDFYKMKLSNGDICTMEGLTQKYFLHRVPKENEKNMKPRINLTFRWVVEHLPGCSLCTAPTDKLANVC